MNYNNKILIAAIIVFFVMIVANSLLFERNKDMREENIFCIEWDNVYDRDNMINNCYDFEHNRWGCLWHIDDEQILHIYSAENVSWQEAFHALNNLWEEIDNLNEAGNFTCTKFITYEIPKNK